MAMFLLFLKDTVIDWYETLSGDVKNNWEAVKDEFHSYFGKSPLDISLTNESDSVYSYPATRRESARLCRPNAEARK